MKRVTVTLVQVLAVCALGFGAPAAAAEGSQADAAAALRLVGELRARQAELDRREREIAERERAQAELERQVELQLAEVAAQRLLVVERIEAWEAEGGDRVKKLSKIYAAMEPVRAAKLLEELEAGLATQILSKMKHKESAAVLEVIEAERALTVSRQVAHPLSFEPTGLEKGVVQ